MCFVAEVYFLSGTTIEQFARRFNCTLRILSFCFQMQLIVLLSYPKNVFQQRATMGEEQHVAICRPFLWKLLFVL